MADKIDRAQFLRMAGAAAGLAVLAGAGCGSQTQPTPASTTAPSPANGPSTPEAATSPSPKASASRPTDGPAYLAVAHGEDPVAITAAAVAALGGMERFVSKGADVIVKPNVCVGYRPPEYAATTNPDVVAAVVSLALEAGAGRVRVMDLGFGSPMEDAYQASGILKAVDGVGGSVEIMSSFKFVDTAIPQGRSIRSWRVYRDIMTADVVINVPIAKTHGSAVLTLGGKNLMGVIADPGSFHSDLSQRIADLVSAVRPALTVVDAYRILTQNGPTGGRLDYVKQARQVIASHDIVAVDAFAATLFDMKASDVPYVVAEAKMGLGQPDLRRLKIEEITL
jgi:uncharacterized protein (DUF362 family)